MPTSAREEVGDDLCCQQMCRPCAVKVAGVVGREPKVQVVAAVPIHQP